jgi:GNAT superfamily N-acetyltransferase
MLKKFSADQNYHLLVGEFEGRVVSSVTLIVVENLTHGIRPYAVMENVVTRADFRGKGFASALIGHARGIAESAGCYKIMLLTGSKQESTLSFYERNGFDRYAKTAFLMKL